MHCAEPGDDDLALWRLEQTHPSRRRSRRVQFTAYGLAALVGAGTVAGAIAAGTAVFETVQSDDRLVVATTESEAYVRPRDLPGDRVRWAARIRWTDDSGTVHRGTTDVLYRLPAGSQVSAGLTSNGTLRQPPVHAVHASLRGLATAAVVAGTGTFAALRILSTGRRRAEDARFQSWEGSWVEWNPRLRSREN